MTNRFRVISKYATCTSPIIPLFAFQKFCISIVSKLSWGGLIPRRNEKQRLRKFFLFLGGGGGGGGGKQGALWGGGGGGGGGEGGGQTRRIMGDVQVAYERFQLIITLHQDI